MNKKELTDTPKALRLLANQIQAPDHVPAMCLRDAATMIEALAYQNSHYLSVSERIYTYAIVPEGSKNEAKAVDAFREAEKILGYASEREADQ